MAAAETPVDEVQGRDIVVVVVAAASDEAAAEV